MISVEDDGHAFKLQVRSLVRNKLEAVNRCEDANGIHHKVTQPTVH